MSTPKPFAVCCSLTLALASCSGAPKPPAQSGAQAGEGGGDPALNAAAAEGGGTPQAPPPIAGTMTAGASQADGNNILWNGGFETGIVRPWTVAFDSPRNGKAQIANGELCIKVDDPGHNPGDIVIRQRPIGLGAGHKYQLRLKTHATAPTKVRARLRQISPPYGDAWSAVVESGTAAQDYTGAFAGQLDDDNVELAVELGGPLAGKAPFTVCLDDVELNDPQYEPPVERADNKPAPKVRVNQVGYVPHLAKIATVMVAPGGMGAGGADQPLEWQLVDGAGKVKASGKTRPFGEDRSSGERVHQIDFSSFTGTGKGLRLKVGADESVAFDVAPDVYHRLKYDALSFFYLQRSGIDIKMPYAGAKMYERAAGHLGDKSVPCAPEAKCSYKLDVSGGWYDAGDQGKYVVNGGFTVGALQAQYEMLARFGATVGDFADGKMKISESKNGRPDLLDEARFGLDTFLRMQVPPGQPMAGMVHHKIHGEKWSSLPTMPDKDDIKRFLRPVSTSATLNLAAMAAQAARLWQKLDPAFSARCLKVAETAYAAAKENPNVRPEKEVQGGGAYGDGDIDDEWYWASVELFITTGKAPYKDDLSKSKFHTPKPGAVASVAGNLGWDHLAPLAKISLVTAPNGLGDAGIAEQRKQLVAAADKFLGNIARRGYRTPLESENAYIWGSNGNMLDAGMILGAAWLLTKDVKYANGVADVMDYILGRNPLAFSYVAGYGERALKNPHHRVWAHQKDAKLPEAPPGAVSGGPNSMLQDPYIRKMGKGGCPPQTCYVDNIESYSTNEVAINWNAALAWDAAVLDDAARTVK